MGIYDNIAELLKQQAQTQIKEAAKECLHDINKVIPVDSGELKASGHIEETAEGISVVYDAEHAIYVHEIPTHSGYKFMERTVDQNRKKYESIIAGGK